MQALCRQGTRMEECTDFRASQNPRSHRTNAAIYDREGLILGVLLDFVDNVINDIIDFILGSIDETRDFASGVVEHAFVLSLCDLCAGFLLTFAEQPTQPISQTRHSTLRCVMKTTIYS
jgi:hypothetical protein